MTGLTDIVLFQLASDPGLPSLAIRSSAPTFGNTITMIGNGVDRATGTTYWDSSWKVLQSSSGATYSGFQTATDHTIRWGENQVSNYSPMNFTDGAGDIRSF